MGSSYNQKDLDIGGLLVLAAYSDTLSLEFVADILISIRACFNSMGEFSDSQEDVQGNRMSNSNLN